MAAAAAAAAAGAALKPFVQLKGSGGELIGDAPPMQMTPPLSSRRRRRRGPKQFAAAAVVASAASSRPISVDNWRNKKRLDGDNNKNNNNKVTPEKLDQWIRDSVEEIVSNIGEAPFLVHVFCNGPMVRLEREEAVPERWPSIKKSWDRGARAPPDGIILVEELKDDAAAAAAAAAEATKTWGLLVQGKGMDSASCYILNTCRVRSTVGFCTHFCLLRAKCFGDPFEMQLRNAWLQ